MKEQYSIVCPHCGSSSIIAPSLFHKLGYHKLGGANCPDCNKTLSIEYDAQADVMIAALEQFDA